MHALEQYNAPESLKQLYHRRRITTVWPMCEKADDMCWLIHHADFTTDKDMTTALSTCLEAVKQAIPTGQQDARKAYVFADSQNYDPALYSQAHRLYAEEIIDDGWQQAINECITALEYADISQQILCDAIRSVIQAKQVKFDNTKYTHMREYQLKYNRTVRRK